MNKLRLPNITLLGIDCVELPRLRLAMDICQEQIEFGEVKMLTSIPNNDPRSVEISPLLSIEAYSEFCIKDLTNYVETDYVLIVQHDGFILNPQSWSDIFLQYDYIGAPWIIEDDFWFSEFKIPEIYRGMEFVGNGGFCIRSKRFLDTSAKLANQDKFDSYQPEDVVMCILHKQLFNDEGIKFAPFEIAKRFSIEGSKEEYSDQFGFHGFGWTDISKWVAENPHYGIRNQFFTNRL